MAVGTGTMIAAAEANSALAEAAAIDQMTQATLDGIEAGYVSIENQKTSKNLSHGTEIRY